jgi:hypothetical protein
VSIIISIRTQCSLVSNTKKKTFFLDFMLEHKHSAMKSFAANDYLVFRVSERRNFDINSKRSLFTVTFLALVWPLTVDINLLFNYSIFCFHRRVLVQHFRHLDLHQFHHVLVSSSSDYATHGSLLASIFGWFLWWNIFRWTGHLSHIPTIHYWSK